MWKIDVSENKNRQIIYLAQMNSFLLIYQHTKVGKSFFSKPFFIFILNMSSSNVSDIADAINWASMMFARCWSVVMFILGIIGHTLSIYVFTRPTLRKNPCARHFLASAVSGYCITCVTIPLRIFKWVIVSIYFYIQFHYAKYCHLKRL